MLLLSVRTAEAWRFMYVPMCARTRSRAGRGGQRRRQGHSRRGAGVLQGADARQGHGAHGRRRPPGACACACVVRLACARTHCVRWLCAPYV